MDYQNNVRNYDSMVSMTSQVKLNTKVCLFRIACTTKRNHDIKRIRNHHCDMNDASNQGCGVDEFRATPAPTPTPG